MIMTACLLAANGRAKLARVVTQLVSTARSAQLYLSARGTRLSWTPVRMKILAASSSFQLKRGTSVLLGGGTVNKDCQQLHDRCRRVHTVTPSPLPVYRLRHSFLGPRRDEVVAGTRHRPAGAAWLQAAALPSEH